jgi:hypothetical protein
MTLVVSTRDRVDREGGKGFADAVLTVVDRDPDVTPPAPTLVSPTVDATYHVRSGARTVPLSARVVDAQSGTARVVFTLNKPADGYYGLLPGSYATLASGTPADGVWVGSVTIPAGETGGDWNVSVQAIDVAHGNQASSGDTWVGPDLWRSWTADGTRVPSSWLHQLPAGQGRFTVLGSSDSTPPSITAAVLTPDRIDTRTSAAQVTVRVRAVDPEGVTRVAYDVRTRPRDGSDPFQRSATLTLTGTPQDGEWTGTLSFPGHPAGRLRVGCQRAGLAALSVVRRRELAVRRDLGDAPTPRRPDRDRRGHLDPLRVRAYSPQPIGNTSNPTACATPRRWPVARDMPSRNSAASKSFQPRPSM